MPIKHNVWKVGAKPAPLTIGRLSSEQQLEDMIVSDPRILSLEWLLIGRQEQTSHGGRVDLLAVAPDGSLVLIELKRDRTPREIIAQALDYASWVETLTPDKISQIFQRFSNGKRLDEEFLARFGSVLDEETLNQSHQIIIVAAELDPSTERIINYLNARDIAINAVFFQVFQNGNEQLLSRAWLIDPGETQANVAATSKTKGEKEPWNGEYYVSYGADRSWDEARQYGFVSGGGGSWYSRTLKLLSPGSRIWVNIPKTGYAGVGIVAEPMCPAKDFKVSTPEGQRHFYDISKFADGFNRKHMNDPELSEYFVRIKWLDTVPANEAVNEVGLFGNQNTVCEPTTPKWRHTVERLKTYFRKWDEIPHS